MSIEFIRDEFLEGKKEELNNIEEELSHKQKKTDRNVLFLRRFTLALMGQYKIHKKLFDKKNEGIEILNKQIIHEFKRPVQRIIPFPFNRLQVPTPGLQPPLPQKPIPQLQIPKPIREELKIPEPLQVNNIHKQESSIVKEKKEFTTPNPL